MKFGKKFPNHQIPEWASNYVNYKGLKKQIKRICEYQNAEEGEDGVKRLLAHFFFSLDFELEKVDDFYNKQYLEYNRRLRKLVSSAQFADETLYRDDTGEYEEVFSVLMELRACLRNLKWYGELNKRALTKILKKLDKKCGTNQQHTYMNSRILPLAFADDQEVTDDLEKINQLLNKISPVENLESLPPPVEGNGKVDEFNQFIANDEADKLLLALTEKYRSTILIPTRKLVSVLNKSSLHESFKCIDAILEILPTLGDPTDISGRNFFHHHVITLGKQYKELYEQKSLSSLLNPSPDIEAASEPNSNKRMVGAFGSDGINSNDSPTSLDYILKKLPAHLRPALLQRDGYKRTPLHYSAQYGLVEVTKIIIECLKSWGAWDEHKSLDDESWNDSEGLTPMHLAIIGTHPATLKALIEKIDKTVTLKDPGLLLLATRLDNAQLIESLLSIGTIDIDYRDPETHESALYLACKLDLITSAEVLLKHDANTELCEKLFGWTPIFIAAVEGYTHIVQLLFDYGAKYDITDDSGWLPMEHAALRGHLQISSMLKPLEIPVASRAASPEPTNLSGPMYKHFSNSMDALADTKKSKKLDLKSKVKNPLNKTVKAFGHSFLQKDESLIIITMGSNDTRNHNQFAVQLYNVPKSKVSNTELDTALSLLVSSGGHSTCIELPIEDTDPITFKVPNKNNNVVYFDLVPTYKQSEGILGRAVALLNSAKTQVGHNRRSLHDSITLPIISSDTMDILGTIHFEFMIVDPFHHPEMGSGRTETYWKSLVSTRVIGHRGLGKNVSNTSSLQLGENTVESFIAAASLGASYVEFDVQLTKDHIPVVYHDFLVAESGVDIPMHELTLEQFLDLNNVVKHHHANRRYSFDDGNIKRSASVQSSFDVSRIFNDRMKLTKTYKKDNFKGNSRGHSIASSFVTLEELFKKIPKNVGFNIECKYPMLDEAEEEDMGTVAVDLNFWVDTVLNVVYNNSKGRDIIFSSFSPDVCVMLSLKQPSIPILFLTEAGSTKMADARAISLQGAIRFAKKWNLLGIVSAAAPIVQAPRLASVVKASGLVCVTYGVLNNDPDTAKMQMDAGVDAVIVDSVLAVRKGLTKEAINLDSV